MIPVHARPDLAAPPSGGGLVGGLVERLAKVVVGLWFRTLDRWVGSGASWLIHAMWTVMSATAHPVLATSAFRGEYATMAVIGATVAVPLLALAAIQAIAHQDPATLVRSALLRLPLAVLFTAVVVQLVQLGLVATDQASAAVLSAGGDPARQLVDRVALAASGVGGAGAAAFAGFLVVLVAAVVGFLLWFELALRAGAVAAATLFLPLALAGSAWSATMHWSRRLGETLTALVLMKLVMAAVLALAAGALASPAGGARIGIAGAVEGVGLLALTALSPFALFRLVPMLEAGAVGHLDGVARRPVRAAASAAGRLAMTGAEGMAGAGLGAADEAAGAGTAGGSGGAGGRGPSGSAGGGPGGPGSGPGGGPGPSGSGPCGGSGPSGSGAAGSRRSGPRGPGPGPGVPERGADRLDESEVAARAVAIGARLGSPGAGPGRPGSFEEPTPEGSSE